MSTNREEFEKWARSVSDNYFPDFSADGISDGGYWQIRTDTAWKAWLACAELKDAEIAKLRDELDACRRANKWHSEEIAHLQYANRDLKAELDALNSQKPLEISYPEYNEVAMGCGLEDRGISCRYEAARYGWDEATERIAELFPDEFYARPVPAIPDCTTCQNRGKVNGDSQETYCENCKHWMTNRKDFYVAANYSPLAKEVIA